MESCKIGMYFGNTPVTWRGLMSWANLCKALTISIIDMLPDADVSSMVFCCLHFKSLPRHYAQGSFSDSC